VLGLLLNALALVSPGQLLEFVVIRIDVLLPELTQQSTACYGFRQQLVGKVAALEIFEDVAVLCCHQVSAHFFVALGWMNV